MATKQLMADEHMFTLNIAIHWLWVPPPPIEGGSRTCLTRAIVRLYIKRSCAVVGERSSHTGSIPSLSDMDQLFLLGLESRQASCSTPCKSLGFTGRHHGSILAAVIRGRM